jgi:hypothetical protein
VTISGDCIGWRLWIEVIDGSVRLLVVRVTSRWDGRLAGRHGGGEGIAWQCDSDVASFDGVAGVGRVAGMASGDIEKWLWLGGHPRFAHQ